ncbi:EGF region [Schistosoma japonicum]|nr:EGF region [Schistosoma japonicum]
MNNMVYFKYFIQTIILKYFFPILLILLYSMFYVQCEENSHKDDHAELDIDPIDLTDTTPINAQLIRTKKEVENSPDNHINIEHIEHHNIETLNEHLNRQNKKNYATTNIDNNNNIELNNNNEDNNLLKSLTNFNEINNYKFQHNKLSNERSTTLPFIEIIVQRTVNKYMNVIRTRSDWLKRLLQLVKEERDIRSRYNCFTDACIYKIQLFTTQLKAHLLRNTVHLEPIKHKDHSSINLHLKRIRRSLSEPSTSTFGLNDSTIEILNDSPEIQDLLFLHDDETEDDALRLPDEVITLNVNKPREDGDMMNWTNNNDSRQKPINFDNSDKINVARFSQELISDVLSKHKIKGQITVTPPFVETTESATTISNTAVSSMPNEQLQISTDNQQNLLLDESNLQPDNLENNVDTPSENTHKEYDSLLSHSMTEQISNKSNDHKNYLDEKSDEGERDSDISTILEEDENEIDVSSLSMSSSERPPLLSSSLDTTVSATDLPNISTDILTTPNPMDNIAEEQSGTNTTPSLPTTLVSSVATTSSTESGQANIYQHTIKPALNIRAISLTVEETLAIPFGLNKFDGRPYENCTGQYENYCYNAIKCVYINVCRTGYTGVRCDMFNLPQTLDILKSFREESIDINSLHQPTAYILHNVIEATARYTVNAVLEERLLSTWEDDTPF